MQSENNLLKGSPIQSDQRGQSQSVIELIKANDMLRNENEELKLKIKVQDGQLQKLQQDILFSSTRYDQNQVLSEAQSQVQELELEIAEKKQDSAHTKPRDKLLNELQDKNALINDLNA